MRTLRQIPKVVGQTDAGETIYEARSARLVLRTDAAHFNRLVRCSKCGREVPGRAVLSSADLERPPQAVVCSDCVEAATEMSPRRPGPPAEPVAMDEPAVTDAQAEMNLGPGTLVDELGGLGDDEDEAPDVREPEEAEDRELVDESDEVPPAEEAAPAVNLQLMDDVAGLDEDELPAPEEDEVLVAGAALDELDGPALADEDVFAVLEEDQPPAPEDDGALFADAGLAEDEPPAPADDEPVMADSGLDEDEAPAPGTEAPTFADVRSPDDGLARRIEALEERLAGADRPDSLRLVALEETVNRLAERADAHAGLQVALQARIDELGAAVAPRQGQKESDALRRLDRMEVRLDQLQGTIDAEWARTKSETAALGQGLSELGERVLRLAEQAGETAGVEDERFAAIEEKVDQATTHLASALESQRRELEEGLQAGLADVRSAVPPSPAAVDDTRFNTLERQMEQTRGEMSDLNELHAALDAGLGVLRSELGEVRTALSRMADAKADLEDRLETFVRMSLVPEGEKGRKAKKAAESTLGTLGAAVQDLLREQRQLKDTVTGLTQASDAATAAAVRASNQAASVSPLRSDMKALHQQVVEQQEALDALRGTVESLRQPPPAAPPPAAKRPAKKAPARAAKAPAAEAKAPVKASRTAKAPAKASRTAKSPAAKKETRAKKA